MKKRKLILLLPFSALVLGGCTFQEGWQTATGWLNDNIWQPVSGFVEDIFNPAGKEEKDEDEKATLKSLSISGDYKQTYSIGEEFDSTGIVVTANYSDNSKKDVTSEATFSGFSSAAKGEVEVTVSYGGKSTKFTVTVVKTEWSSEDLALFDSYLHGFELPFFDAPGFSLSYEQGWVRGKGCTITADELLAYEALFTEAAGYEDITSEYEDVTDGSFKAFKHSVSTEQGTRFIDILVYTFTGSSYSLGGQFVVEAQDAYNYEFPDTDALFEKYPLLTKFDIPTMELPDGGYYYSQEGSSNAMYYQYGYYTYMSFMVWGYNASPETFAAFHAKFSTWTVEETQGAYTAKLFLDDTHYAEVSYKYETDTRIIKYNITLGVYELQFWPTEEVAQMVEALVPGSTTVIPAFEDQEEYVIYSQTEVDVYGSSSTMKEDYVSLLTGASWTAHPTAEDTYISPAQDISVELYFSAWGGYLEIKLYKYVAPSAQWPTEDVAALFPAGTQDVLPPFEGEATAYQPYDDSYKGVTVFVGEGNEESSIAAYATTLLEANFTESETKPGFYESPSKEYYVELWKGTDGAFNIEVSMIAHWPTSDVASQLSALVPGATDSIPSMEGASSYKVSTEDSVLKIVASYSSSTEAFEAQEAYIELLTKAEFEYAGDDEYGDPYYNSPNEEFNINPWVSSSNSLVIDIREGVFTPPTAGFDAAGMNALLKEISPTLKDALPEYSTDLIYTFDTSDDGDGIQIMAMPADVETEIGLFTANLLANDFTEAGADQYGDMHYTSPTGELDVCAWNYYDYYIVIDVLIN